MTKQCKTCQHYDVGVDAFYHQFNEMWVIVGPGPDRHYCNKWGDDKVIPKEVWENETQCPHYEGK